MDNKNANKYTISPYFWIHVTALALLALFLRNIDWLVFALDPFLSDKYEIVISENSIGIILASGYLTYVILYFKCTYLLVKSITAEPYK